MERIPGSGCDAFMGFNAHHHIRRFDTDDQIIIIQRFDHLYFISRHMTVFFNNRFFQRTAVDTDTNRKISGLCRIHNGLYPVRSADISRIDPYLIHTVFHSRNGQPVIKMNIAYQRDMNLFFDFFNGLCRFHRRHSNADNIAARFFQLQNLSHRAFYIFCFCITHGLNGDRMISSDLTPSNGYDFCIFPNHQITLPFLPMRLY